MCKLITMPETYMVVTKEKDGHKAFCHRTLEEAFKAQHNLKAVELLVGSFRVIDDVYFGKGPELREVIFGFNAKEKLLGITYKEWNYKQKFSAHLRIWKYAISLYFGGKEFKPEALNISFS